jgi:hypothetical protein
MKYVNMKTVLLKTTKNQYSRLPHIVARDGSRIMRDGEIRIATKLPLRIQHGRYCISALSPKDFYPIKHVLK